MRILVTDSDARSALAATRSLGKRGHVVITAGESAASLAAASRYSHAFVQYPSPARHPDGFLTAVANGVREHAVELAMPMAEVTTTLLAAHRDKLGDTCALPLADHAIISRASDKGAMVELAEMLGVPTPRTRLVLSADEGRSVRDMPYPIVVKPSRSRVLTRAGWIGTTVAYANSADDLEQRLRNLPPEAFPVLLQERIRGPGVGFFACYNKGRIVATFAHKRVREKPPSGGVSTLAESTTVDPQAFDYGTRLLNNLQWHGVAMVEFKRSDQDGVLRLMEINARFWGSLQLAIDAGVDFPSMLADLSRGYAPATPPPYRLGVRSRWLLGDIDAALMILLRRRSELNLPPTFPSRWRFIADVLRRDKNVKCDVFDASDIGPWWLELRQWTARLF